MQADGKLRIATIGAVGHVGPILDGMREDPSCAFVAAARSEPDENLGRMLNHDVAKRDMPKVYDDYRCMLDEVKPDIACVFMRYHRNAEGCTEAARRGCHVICEKPIATELDDLYGLRDVVRQAGIRLTSLLTMRYEPHLLAARNAVAAGRIGEPLLAFGQKSYKFGTRPEWYKDRRTFGGTIPWVAIHAIDFVRFVTGLDYTSVTALHANKAHPDYPGLEDCGAILMALSNGGQAVISFDYLRPEAASTHGDDRLRIAGSQGVVEVRLAEDICELIKQTGSNLELPHTEQTNFFADLVKELRSHGKCLISQEDSFGATEIALKARQAADTNSTISLQ